MNYEIRVINSLLNSGNYVEAVNEGIENVFVEHRDIWNFVMQHYDEHKKTPSKDTVKHHYPDFEFINTPEPLSYYLIEAKKESLSYQTRQIISKANNMLKDMGPKEAMSYLMHSTSQLYKFSSSLKDTDLVGEWKDRANDLKKRSLQDSRDIPGIPSGIKVLDKSFGGWQPGDFVVLLGWTGVGKSFIARLFAVNAW
jgi:replicative DNA helicase